MCRKYDAIIRKQDSAIPKDVRGEGDVEEVRRGGGWGY